MGISIFPSTAAEFVSNNFVIDMNDTTNNTADTGGIKQAGPYSMSFSSGDATFDVYLINDEGESVGYSNGTSITASALFSTVVILGVSQSEIISFTYQGSVNNADGQGDEPGAAAYLESITPSDLPTIDDTATVAGGNFGANTEITFESGATVLPAKNIVVNNSNELVVTRPDDLIEDDAPYTLRAKTTGVPEPTGTNVNLLTDAVTAGSDPTWVTTAIDTMVQNNAFSQQLEATDAEGTVSYAVETGSLPTGVTLSSSGLLSGTPTAPGDGTITLRATDDGGNITDKQFEITYAQATGGTVRKEGNLIVHEFSSSGTFTPLVDMTVDFVIAAGGGGGGASTASNFGGGGGGAGGLITSISNAKEQKAQESLTASTGYSFTVGAFGAGAQNTSQAGQTGSDSTAFGYTAKGGGGGGTYKTSTATSGGSGGGAYARNFNNGSTIDSTQGSDGGDGASSPQAGGGGGGFLFNGGQAQGTSGSGSGGDGGAGLEIFSKEYSKGGGGGSGGFGPNGESGTDPGGGGPGTRFGIGIRGQRGTVVVAYELVV